jgi:type II secretory pathway component PulF
MYPVIVVVMMIAVMVIMLIFVIPQLTVLYDNLDIALPLSTQIVVGLSSFLVNFWPLIIGVGIASFFYLRHWRKTDAGKRAIDALILKLPIFGKLVTQSMMVEFSRTLGLLIGTGSLVVDSLMRSSEVVGNYQYRDAIVLVARRVEKGISMGDAMEATPVFPPILVQMVKIGEETGKLDDALNRASEYFEREVEQTVKTLTTAMEPVIMIVLALGVGFLIFSVITPIYSLISSIQ